MCRDKQKIIFVISFLLLFETLSVLSAESSSLNFKFYGVVLDQYDDPVSDANVEAQVSYKGSLGKKQYRYLHSITDSEGKFTFKSVGSVLFILDIVKKGYEFRFEKNPRQSFYFRGIYEKAIHDPEPNRPVIFKVKKKNEPAYLIHRPSLERNFYPNDTRSFALSLLTTWIDEYGNLKQPEQRGYSDLRIYCETDYDDKTYSLRFVEMDTNSGLVLKEQKLNEAPEFGYKDEIIIKTPITKNPETINKYLYVKGRGGNIYSRLDVELIPRLSGLHVKIDLWTNPEGSRNLRYNEKFQEFEQMRRYDLRDRLYLRKMDEQKRKKILSYKPRKDTRKQVEDPNSGAQKEKSENKKGMYFFDPYD